MIASVSAMSRKLDAADGMKRERDRDADHKRIILTARRAISSARPPQRCGGRMGGGPATRELGRALSSTVRVPPRAQCRRTRRSTALQDFGGVARDLALPRQRIEAALSQHDQPMPVKTRKIANLLREMQLE